MHKFVIRVPISFQQMAKTKQGNEGKPNIQAKEQKP